MEKLPFFPVLLQIEHRRVRQNSDWSNWAADTGEHWVGKPRKRNSCGLFSAYRESAAFPKTWHFSEENSSVSWKLSLETLLQEFKRVVLEITEFEYQQLSILSHHLTFLAYQISLKNFCHLTAAVSSSDGRNPATIFRKFSAWVQ